MDKPVTILGAGIVGICTALSLLERGVPVTLIDRADPGQATSMGNAGVVSPWSIIPQSLPGIWKNIPSLLFGYGRPLSIHPQTALRMIPWGARFLRQGREDRVRASADAMSLLCGPAIDLYQRHLIGTGHEGLIADAMYVHAFRDGSRATLSAIDYRIRAEMGAELELVGRDALTRIEPALAPDFNAAVLVKGQARVLSPGLLGTVLMNKALSLGAAFKRRAIQRLQRHGDRWVIHCEDEMLTADRVVIALGAWSSGLLKDAGLKVPLMAERGYHVQFPDPGITLNNSVMDVDAKVVASSMQDGLRVAGQAEFAPVDAPASKRRQKLLLKIAKRALPDLQTDGPSYWMGRRPSFPDSLPMIGPVDGMPGLFLNFGHSHYGLMMAPKSGDYVGQMISGDMANANLAPFSPKRFGGAG